MPLPLGLKLILTIYCSLHHSRHMFWGTFLDAETVALSEASCQKCQAWTCSLPGAVLSAPRNNGELRQHILSAQHAAPLLSPVLLHQPSHPSPHLSPSAALAKGVLSRFCIPREGTIPSPGGPGPYGAQLCKCTRICSRVH